MAPICIRKTLGGRELAIETGRLAQQAHGAVTVRYGDTVCLVAAVSAKPREGIDFFPLTVDYREMAYAAGKFPGGFFKREGRPTSKEILTARAIDRPLRPLFPEHYKDDVAIYAVAMSSDKLNDPDLCAMNGASAALAISPIPLDNPTGNVRVGRIGGQFVLNPTIPQLAESDLDLLLTCTAEAPVMIEVRAKEVPEAAVAEAIQFGFKACQEIIAMIRELQAKAGKPKTAVPPPPAEHPLAATLASRYGEAYRKACFHIVKAERRAAMRAIRERALAELAKEFGGQAGQAGWDRGLGDVWDKLETSAIRTAILKEGRRIDGRGLSDLRPLSSEVGVLPRVHGSAIFNRGETQALSTLTLGTSFDEQKIDGLRDEYYKRFLLHYNFPAYSTGETWPNRGPKRREIGHGDLAERSLEAIIPPPEKFPYTMRIVSEIMSSNGSTSMASVCSGTLALMDAGVPIKDPVAGISIGLVKEGNETKLLVDILGEEDHHGDMDFKVSGTQHGITGVQLDLKIPGIPMALIPQILSQAREARMKILRSMLATLDRPRATLSAHAPKLVQIMIPPEKIGKLVGPGGRTIRELQERTKCEIDVEDSGRVSISSKSGGDVQEARAYVEGLTAMPEVGRVYAGRVTGIKDFGAFVEFLPGQEGLCHISEIADGYVEKVMDHLKMGDSVRVKVLNVEDSGKIRLSIKAAQQGEPKAAATS